MKSKARIVILFLFIALGLIWCTTLYYRRPHVRRYQRFTVTVHQVQHRSALKALYVIVTKIKGKTIVEIVRGPGLSNVEILRGKAALRYLQTHALN